MSAAALLCAALAGRAHAGHGGDPKADDDAKADDDQADGDPDGEVKAKDGAPEIEVSGRVYARYEAYQDDFNDWSGAFSLPSARVGVKYAWKKRLAAKVSFEARGSVRDAYVDVALTPCLHLRGGRFKVPVSAIERTSTWTLPTIDRTVVSDVLGGGIDMVGRHSGAQLTWEYDAGVHPSVELSLVQAHDVDGNDLGAIRLADGSGVTATLRGELEPVKDVKVGAFVQNRDVLYTNLNRTELDRYWAGGVDLEAEAGGLRLWGDVIAGTSHLGTTLAKDTSTPFVAAQLIAGWRAGGKSRGKKYVEPFVAGAMVNPVAVRKHDLVTEVKVGVAAGRWKRWRGQLQLALLNTEYAVPTGLGGVGVPDIADKTTVSVQLGAGF